MEFHPKQGSDVEEYGRAENAKHLGDVQHHLTNSQGPQTTLINIRKSHDAEQSNI